MQLSVRVETSNRSKGQAGHDFEGRPTYANEDKKHLNKIVFGGTETEIKELIDSQSESIINRYNQNQENRKKGLPPKERQKIGKWRSTTATHKKAIITFNKEFRTTDNESKIDRKKLDQCALNFFTKLCEEKGCELTYIVRHDDETTPHYHAMFTNFNGNKLKPLNFQMKDLSALQTKGGEAFAPLNIERGTMRNVRLAIAREDNPKLENESGDDYSKRIYEISNVKNKTVSQLHDTQEKDFKLQIAKLESSVEGLNADIEKIEKNLIVAKSKLDATNKDDVEAINKREKNIATYVRRLGNKNLELQTASKKLDDINFAQESAEREVDLLKEQVLKLKDENHVLIEDNEKLKVELQNNVARIEHLANLEMPTDLTETYNVRVSRGLGGLADKHIDMKLSKPTNANKFLKRVQAHALKNQSTSRALDKLSEQLGRKETDLQKRISAVEKRETNVDEAVMFKLNNIIGANGLEISNRVIERAKMWNKQSFVQCHEQTRDLNDSEVEAFKNKMDDEAVEDSENFEEFADLV